MTIRRSTSRLFRRSQAKPGGGVVPPPPAANNLITDTGALLVTDSGVELIYVS